MRGMSLARRESAAANRAKVIEAARTLFSVRGFSDVGLAEIASLASMTKAGAAYMFRSKADLFEAAMGAPPEFEQPAVPLTRIPGFESYAAAEDGAIWRTAPHSKGSHKNRPLPYRLKAGCNVRGYPVVAIAGDCGVTRWIPVHRLVAFAFLGPPPSPVHEIAHRDGDPGNPSAANLRWATHAENMSDTKAHGTFSSPPVMLGESNPSCRLSTEAVTEIRSRYRWRSNSAALAREFGVDQGTISGIANRSHRPCG